MIKNYEVQLSYSLPKCIIYKTLRFLKRFSFFFSLKWIWLVCIAGATLSANRPFSWECVSILLCLRNCVNFAVSPMSILSPVLRTLDGNGRARWGLLVGFASKVGVFQGRRMPLVAAHSVHPVHSVDSAFFHGRARVLVRFGLLRFSDLDQTRHRSSTQVCHNNSLLDPSQTISAVANCWFSRVAVTSAKNHKRQRRKRQSVTAKREKSQTPKVLTAILTLPNLT